MNDTIELPINEGAKALLQQFRQEIYDCLKREKDTLFNLCDALRSRKSSAVVARAVLVARIRKEVDKRV